ncbi:MAG: glycosyltransferase [Desulfuromonadales bacterium]|nr:glycosyltransferase [Desulfuromonadales bacterium]
MSRLILYAPGVHTGGGLVLLKELLAAPVSAPQVIFLDSRSRDQVQIPAGTLIFWCAPTLSGRLKAEFRVRSLASPGDVLLCFHGLPPFLRSSARVVVFIQNRLNLGEDPVFSGKVTLLSKVKRVLFRLFAGNADQFMVQTPSMRLAVQKCLGETAPVEVFPFLNAIDPGEGAADIPAPAKEYDFIFVADGVPHKNHRALVDAWILLARQEVRPSLILTLGSRDQHLWNEIERTARLHGLHIGNAGEVDRNQIFALYRRTRALVFPSMTESFGIPLLEASRFGLPIIASELDYVRDVCVPAETFDPRSPVSIARAAMRFMNVSDQPVGMKSAEEFLSELLRHRR